MDLPPLSSLRWGQRDRFDLFSGRAYLLSRWGTTDGDGGGRFARASRGAADEGSDPLSDQRSLDVSFLAQVEHQDREIVLHAQGDRCGIHDRQSALQHLDVLERVEL